METSVRLRLAALLLVAIAFASTADHVSAASPATFSSASGAISTAFVAVHQAGNDGGNVTGLVASLNAALQLYSQAEAENATQPAKASSDLTNATQIANGVSAEAPAIGQQGAAARQTQLELSIGSATVIVVLAALIYVFGDRIYRRAWLRLYSGYTVKKVG